MDKLEMMQHALNQLGDAPPQELAAFIRQRYGVKIEARFIPIFKATLRNRTLLNDQRQQRRDAAETPAA